MTRPAEQDQWPPEPEMRQLVQDWITLWQSELAALAADREAQEEWRDMLALWARFAVAVTDGAAGCTGSAAPPWPAAAHPTPDARDAEIERLSRLVSKLESRLSRLERRCEPGAG